MTYAVMHIMPDKSTRWSWIGVEAKDNIIHANCLRK